MDEMPWADFLELVAFDSIAPIGPERADFVSAAHTAALINTVRGAVGATGEPVKALDLMPFRQSDPEDGGSMYQPVDAEDELHAVFGMFSAMKIVRANPQSPE
jgi:hypothetical protein